MKKWMKITRTILLIALFLLIIQAFETWGLIGILIFLVSFVAYKFWVQRELLMVGLRDTETRIWGRPLDKELWDKKEMKNTKLKFVWRKKKNAKLEKGNNK